MSPRFPLIVGASVLLITACGELSRVFAQMYAARRRSSIPPERLLKSQLLIALYSVRSDRCSASS